MRANMPPPAIAGWRRKNMRNSQRPTIRSGRSAAAARRSCRSPADAAEHAVAEQHPADAGADQPAHQAGHERRAAAEAEPGARSPAQAGRSGRRVLRRQAALHRRGAVGRGVGGGRRRIGARCRGCPWTTAAAGARAARTPARGPGQGRRRRRAKRERRMAGSQWLRCTLDGDALRAIAGARRMVVMRRDGHAPAIVMPSTRTVGASVPRRKRRSSAGVRWANISSSVPGDGDLATGSASAPSRIMKPAAPRL